MKIARLILSGFASLAFITSAYALPQDTQSSDESTTQVASADQNQELASNDAKRGHETAESSKADLNTASAEELAKAGLGKKRAEAVVAWRDAHPNAKFKSIDDLSKVKGISRSYLKKHREQLENTLEIS